MLEIQWKAAAQPLTGAWRDYPIPPRGTSLLGISFRPLQAAAFGLDTRAALKTLLGYSFQLVRLGAYWNQFEPVPGKFLSDELDWQIDAAEKAGKQIIICVGPVKTFGYPEFFVPAHRLAAPFPERSRIRPSAYADLLGAATDWIARLVEHYRGCGSLIAWQLEHEAVDPLGIEHSWRLDADFVAREALALHQADPTRPLVMNGFLPATWPGRLMQAWRTRDQGDSLALARRLADWVGVDDYPRIALLAISRKTVYLDGSRSARAQRNRRDLLAWARAKGKRLLVTEGQAEPWETTTTPPSLPGKAMYSCRPEDLIATYAAWKAASAQEGPLFAYLFWGAEYWLLRQAGGDDSYIQAFNRILDAG